MNCRLVVVILILKRKPVHAFKLMSRCKLDPTEYGGVFREIRSPFKVLQDRPGQWSPAHDQLKDTQLVHYRLAYSYALEILWTTFLGSD
jgi:hypothetical protein